MQATLSKTKDIAERYLLEQMWQKLETFIDAVLADTKSTLVEDAKKLANNMISVADKLREEISNDADTAVSKINTIASQNTRFLNEKQVAILNDVTRRAEKVINDAEAKAERILAALDTMRGPQGEPGPKGEKGADGSPDTPDEVVAKINSAKTKININAIAGLSKAFERLQRNGKSSSGGGGMGNVIHESKDVTSATTEVILQHKVAGASAIWIAYQGQTLALGTHYSVSGKTITLLFTPVDSTVLDITYIRA